VRATALVLLLAMTAICCVVFVRAPEGYSVQDREHIGAGASAEHWVGTDELGRDRGERIAGAFLLGMAGAVAASLIATCLALLVGVASAFVHAGASRVLAYGTDLFLTLPWLFLLMMVRSALPLTMAPMESAAVTFLLLALLGWPLFARMHHARAAALRDSEWLLQGRAAGVTATRLAWRYVLPHLRPLFLMQFVIYVPVCLAAEANLGTIGLGVAEPLPSWGSMLGELSHSAMGVGSHWAYLPLGVLVGVLVLMEMLVFEVRR